MQRRMRQHSWTCDRNDVGLLRPANCERAGIGASGPRVPTRPKITTSRRYMLPTIYRASRNHDALIHQPTSMTRHRAAAGSRPRHGSNLCGATAADRKLRVRRLHCHPRAWSPTVAPSGAPSLLMAAGVRALLPGQSWLIAHRQLAGCNTRPTYSQPTILLAPITQHPARLRAWRHDNAGRRADGQAEPPNPVYSPDDTAIIYQQYRDFKRRASNHVAWNMHPSIAPGVTVLDRRSEGWRS